MENVLVCAFYVVTTIAHKFQGCDYICHFDRLYLSGECSDTGGVFFFGIALLSGIHIQIFKQLFSCIVDFKFFKPSPVILQERSSLGLDNYVYMFHVNKNLKYQYIKYCLKLWMPKKNVLKKILTWS